MKIKELRKRQKLTQKDLADYLGVSRSTVAMWETGINEPGSDLLQKMSSLFSVSIDYIITGEDTPKPKEAPTAESSERPVMTPEERQLLDSFRALNASGKMHVLSTAAMCAQNPAFTDNTEESSLSQIIS